MTTATVTPKLQRTRALSVFMMLGLAACTAADGGGSPPAEPSVAAPAPTLAVRAPVTPPVEREREIKAPKPAEILGSTSSRLVTELGSATLVRTDIGAEIWQYRTEDCVLFLFLYPGASEMSVKHIDSRGGPSPEHCIRSVVKTKLSRKLS